MEDDATSDVYLASLPASGVAARRTREQRAVHPGSGRCLAPAVEAGRQLCGARPMGGAVQGGPRPGAYTRPLFGST